MKQEVLNPENYIDTQKNALLFNANREDCETRGLIL